MCCFEVEASQYGMQAAPKKCKVPMQDWREPVPALHIESDLIEAVYSFVYLESVILDYGTIEKDLSPRISRDMPVFSKTNASLHHLW